MKVPRGTGSEDTAKRDKLRMKDICPGLPANWREGGVAVIQDFRSARHEA